MEHALSMPEYAKSSVSTGKAAAKFLGFISLALLFIGHHQLLTFYIRNKYKRQRAFLKSIQLYSKAASALLQIKTSGPTETWQHTGKLIVCNHLSYIDVLILFSRYPALFVTSMEIKETFFLGRLASLGCCFFVERRKNLRSESVRIKELEDMAISLESNFNVFLFPEGTSSPGDTVLPFKANFFQLAIDCQTSIKPLVIKYVGRSSSQIPWYGSMTFADHLYRICQLEELSVSLSDLPEVSGSDYTCKFELANKLHSTIREQYERH